MIHAVAPVRDQQGWSNVMYIPAAPLCEKNRLYARHVAQALAQGHSPGDFPPEHYEAAWDQRFRPEDLNLNGRRSLDLA